MIKYRFINKYFLSKEPKFKIWGGNSITSKTLKQTMQVKYKSIEGKNALDNMLKNKDFDKLKQSSRISHK